MKNHHDKPFINRTTMKSTVVKTEMVSGIMTRIAMGKTTDRRFITATSADSLPWKNKLYSNSGTL